MGAAYELADSITRCFAQRYSDDGNGKLEAGHFDCLRSMIEIAIRNEHEECAKIVEKLAGADEVYPAGIKMIASTIRVRGV